MLSLAFLKKFIAKTYVPIPSLCKLEIGYLLAWKFIHSFKSLAYCLDEAWMVMFMVSLGLQVVITYPCQLISPTFCLPVLKSAVWCLLLDLFYHNKVSFEFQISGGVPPVSRDAQFSIVQGYLSKLFRYSLVFSPFLFCFFLQKWKSSLLLLCMMHMQLAAGHNFPVRLSFLMPLQEIWEFCF